MTYGRFFGGVDKWRCGVVVGGLEVFANGWGMVVSGWWVVLMGVWWLVMVGSYFLIFIFFYLSFNSQGHIREGITCLYTGKQL